MASVNNMGFNDLAATLNAIYGQVTGGAQIAPITNTNDFVSVAQTVLKSGFDPIMGAISQVLDRTIYSVRSYTRKFDSLFVTNQAYGAHTRKINYIDTDFVPDMSYDLTDGGTCDQYIIRKPKVIQTNFYGFNRYADYQTVFEDQLRTAFRGPDELASFWANAMTEIENKHAQADEAMAKAAVANFVAGKTLADTASVIHLLTEYNAQTGLQLTATTVYQPDNYEPFIRWLYGRVAAISSAMTDRTINYHVNLTDGVFKRHTPYSRQKVMLFAPEKFAMESRALATTYHDSYLKLASNETVNYWINPDEPMQIQAAPTYITPSGTLTTGANTTVDKVFGVIFDDEAMGITKQRESTKTTPPNARCDYYNIWWKWVVRYWNDFTENAVVLLLD